jgi:hypothetical protein
MDVLVEISRTLREAERHVAARMAAQQFGEAFPERPAVAAIAMREQRGTVLVSSHDTKPNR